uniref:NAB domain-containing protein n=2 Tax=Quercus lobata TaxID=97700 RepID=A0A7N2RAG8_QUELO
MEERVKNTLKIIDQEGDSFAQRAEMYYRKRPELVGFVEESFRAYRALAERYDRLSTELQSANHTIATVFPERVEYAIGDDDDDDDEEEENLPGTSTSFNDPNNLDMVDKAVPHSSIPKVPKIPTKDFRSLSMSISRKGPPMRTSSSAKAAVIQTSGLSKAEALKEIDKLQKEILALQTEMEFAQRLYERGYEKYWEFENQITETHKRVCSLQDEFGINNVIEDDEARSLMATSALKSCQQTLVMLQEKHEKSVEDANAEHQRIKKAHEKFGTLKGEILSKQMNWQESMRPELKDLDQEIIDEEQERHDILSKQTNRRESMRLELKDLEQEKHDKIVKLADVNSNTSLTVMELAENIDQLVTHVVALETSVSSQVVLVNRLRSETDELHAHIRSLEEAKKTLMQSSDIMSNRIKELEEEVLRMKNQIQCLTDQNNNLQTHSTEASCNLDHLSGNLQSVKQDEEVEDTVMVDKVRAVPDAKAEENLDEESDKIAPYGSTISKDVMAEKAEKNDDDTLALNNSVEVEGENQPNSSNDLSLMPEKEKTQESDKMAPYESIISKDVMAEKVEKNEDDTLALNNSIGVEGENQPNSSNDLSLMPEKEKTQESDMMAPYESIISKDVMAEKAEKNDDDTLALNNSGEVEGENRPNSSNDLSLMPEKEKTQESDMMAPYESIISKDVMAEKAEKNDDDTLALNNSIEVERETQPNSSNDLSLMPEKGKTQEPIQQEKDEKQDLPETVDGNLDVKPHDSEAKEEEDQPIWKSLFVKGLEDREKILLEELTTVFTNYKSVRNTLSEVEQKNRDSIFELAMQVREMKSAITSKDEVIQSLQQKLGRPTVGPYTTPEIKYIQQNMPQTSLGPQVSKNGSDQYLLADFFGELYPNSTETNEKSHGNLKLLLENDKNKMRRLNHITKQNATLAIEEKIRSDIDDLLEENLEFWLRISSSVQQLQKFQSSIQDLREEYQKLKNKQHEGSGKKHSLQSDARPIYRHLREIQTELSLWLEHNAVLKDDLQNRFSSLCIIQAEISTISNTDSKADKTDLCKYQAAKFQGEILNMKQENNKIFEELHAGLNRVKSLKVDVEKMLTQLDEELGLKKYITNRARIPLRSFLFGAKSKKQKPSIFSCVTPALQKQYSDMAAGVTK